jgi:metal-responsive CopG/Arc/MetJ family transcriptional regulator
MRTAISVDDKLLREADRIANKMGVSRSQLFSLALEAFLRERRQPDPVVAKLKTKFRSALKDKW